MKPRVARNELPWETSGVHPSQPEEVAPTPRMVNPIRRDCGMASFLFMHNSFELRRTRGYYPG